MLFWRQSVGDEGGESLPYRTWGMLERTACLESGSLRRLIPGSKKPFKSQRMLHSTFWVHGAGELDLPPLWAMLMGQYNEARDTENKEIKASSVSPATSGFLLDFFYPAGTVTFLRQFSGWPLVRQNSKHAKSSFTRFGHRLFSSGTAATNRNVPSSELPSVEEDTMPGFEHASEDVERTRINQSHDMEGKGNLRPIRELKNLMNADGPKIDHEEVWRQFSILPPNQEHLVVSDVLKYLSTSSRRIDIERVISLLDLIPPQVRDDDVWRCGINAFISIDNVAEAVIFHRMALEYKIPSLTPILIAAQFTTRDWGAARDSYTAHLTAIPYQETSKPRRNDPILQEAAAVMPEFAAIALDLAQEVIVSRTWNPQTGAFDDFKDFAVLLAREALIPPSGTFNARIFRELVEIMQIWVEDPPELYTYLHFELNRRNYISLLIGNYHEYRQRHPKKIALAVIRDMLHVFCERHHTRGIQWIFDDSFASLGEPETSTYVRSMRELAWQGNAQAVEALFEQYTDRFWRVDTQIRLKNADEVTPLLNVYAKRGELHRVISIFDQIETKYQVKPSLMCWNILINAYGKVQDVDGAFKRFEQLLESPHKPDHWTIGTLMGICVTRGDADRAMEVFRLAISLEIPVSTAMIDCLVLAKIQENELGQAQELCEKALKMKLESSSGNKSPQTRMWNQVLNAYALRRDINGTNRVLQRMSELGVEYDDYTYSALMQSLAMVKQANVAWQMLTEVMPKAGVIITNFHYAIVMGAFLATGEIEMLFETYDRMLSRHIKPHGGASITALKASAILDQRRLYESSLPGASNEQARFELAEEYFDQVIRSLDPYEWISSTPRKGMGREPVDTAYITSVYSYMIFVYGVNRMMDRVKQLYADYIEALPENRREEVPPIRMLEALIKANLKDGNYVGVEQCWELAFEGAKKSGSSIKADSGQSTVLSSHRFSLSLALMSYIEAMALQDKFDELGQVIAQVEAAGFVLDNKNWNVYIQHLVRARYIQQAFHFCETKLMPNWTGWKELRWRDAGKQSALPLETRMRRRDRGHLYPFYYTLLCMARAWLDANDMAAENDKLRGVVTDLEMKCPRIVGAVNTMPRTLDPLEMKIMTSDEW